jgi:hypothetical protein
VSVFVANGQYSNDRGQHSTWSISEPGVIHVGHVYLQTVVLSNGQLQQRKFLGRAGPGINIFGIGVQLILVDIRVLREPTCRQVRLQIEPSGDPMSILKIRMWGSLLNFSGR